MEIDNLSENPELQAWSFWGSGGGCKTHIFSSLSLPSSLIFSFNVLFQISTIQWNVWVFITVYFSNVDLTLREMSSSNAFFSLESVPYEINDNFTNSHVTHLHLGSQHEFNIFEFYQKVIPWIKLNKKSKQRKLRGHEASKF